MALGAYAHQELPFEKLVEELQIERDLSRNPLFQVTFQLINPPTLSAQEGTGSGYERMRALSEIQRGTAMFDIAFDLLETPAGFEGILEYSTDLFDASTIRRMGRHFVNVLAAAVQSLDAPISDLRCETRDPASQPTGAQSVAPWRASDATLHRLFESQAERSPDDIAVTTGAARTTFGQLNARANQLAHVLMARGIGTDGLAGICLDRSIEMVVAMLAVLKAGAGYVPLDPRQPAARLSSMLGGLAAVIVRGPVSTLDGRNCPVIDLDAMSAELSASPATNPSRPCFAESAAYVIYTSGSSGTPKGVSMPHRAICNHMLWMQARFPLTRSDRVLQRTPVTFDASVWEVWAPLLAGARLVLGTAASQADTTELVHLIAAEEITVLQLVPSLLRLLVEEPSLRRCSSLKRIFSGGEPLTRDIRDRVLGSLRVELHNLYGPTEAAIDTTYYSCSDGRTRRWCRLVTLLTT